ncbi:MAG: ParB/RepB/Spo0J family partition protein, partial [Streptosporangiaceae bacterium]
MTTKARSKADLLGPSSSFAAATSPIHMQRGRLAEAMEPEAEQAEASPRVARLEDLAANPENPRDVLAEIQDMADSLLELGQLQVVTVVTRAAFLAKYPGRETDIGAARWVVLHGNRRLAGARLAGLDELRIDVRDDLAADLFTNAFVENLKHETYRPVEEARALERLVEEHGGLRAAARKITRSHVWIGQRLALLQLLPELQAAVESGALYVEDGRQIGRLPQAEQAAAAEQAVAARLAQKSRRAAGRRAGGAAAGDGGGTDGAGDDAAPPPGATPPPAAGEAGG